MIPGSAAPAATALVVVCSLNVGKGLLVAFVVDLFFASSMTSSVRELPSRVRRSYANLQVRMLSRLMCSVADSSGDCAQCCARPRRTARCIQCQVAWPCDFLCSVDGLRRFNTRNTRYRCMRAGLLCACRTFLLFSTLKLIYTTFLTWCTRICCYISVAQPISYDFVDLLFLEFTSFALYDGFCARRFLDQAQAIHAPLLAQAQRTAFLQRR